MDDTALMDSTHALASDRPGAGKRVGILGVPLGFGCGLPGVDIGPAAIRVARLSPRIAQLGYDVRDLGDMRIARPLYVAAPSEKLKYLKEMTEACEAIGSGSSRHPAR